MDRFIKEYKEYLFGEQRASQNTIQAYVRDIRQYDRFLFSLQTDIYKANKTNVLSYILSMQKENIQIQKSHILSHIKQHMPRINTAVL